ncbi:MAG: RNA methyltransferase [Treponema sp.]|jgi:tRNA/rRNA methyltransferase/tRNA (cytidine32/uridine32-2'-O)-methyltransferase|nr:RNA methyltransferase [Treponema sp.]
MDLRDIVVVLSRVSEPGNVGAVCRAMKNMGLSRLRIAGPGPFSDQDEALIRARAVHAADIWERAEFFDSLGPALADLSLAVGVTRRRGRCRKQASLSPGKLAAWFREKPGSVALVFGNERTGLEDHELDLCNIASHIPASGAFPSLNLSHAVQIYAYELFLALGSGAGTGAGAAGRGKTAAEGGRIGDGIPSGADGGKAAAGDGGIGAEAVKGAWVPLSHGEAAGLAASITGTLASLGFYRHPGREIQERFLRDLICRAGLTVREGRYLEDIFVKAGRLGAKGSSMQP